MIRQIVRIWNSCESNSLKAVLIFPKNYHKFRSCTIEKPGIINFYIYSSKSYASVFISYSLVAFLQEGEKAATRP